jgi:hypothetical protein
MGEFEIVYVLTNSAMPNLVKIGLAAGADANACIAQLFSTGVPVPFKLEYACRVTNASKVEQALHIAFSPNRVNPNRESFRIEPEQAIALLKLLDTQDATSEVDSQPADVDEQSLAATDKLRKRRPNLNFIEMSTLRGGRNQSSKDRNRVDQGVVGVRRHNWGNRRAGQGKPSTTPEQRLLARSRSLGHSSLPEMIGISHSTAYEHWSYARVRLKTLLDGE